MKSYSFSGLLMLFLLSWNFLNAQESCGTDLLHERAMVQDTEYRDQVFRNEKIMRESILRGDFPLSAGPDQQGTYLIPVVFHIIHTGEAIGSSRNPSDTKIQAALDYANRIFSAGTGFTNSVPFPVKFVLAKRAPDCQPTNGINRIDASHTPKYAAKGISISNDTNYATEMSIKNLSRWSNTDYYNIWVVHNIQTWEGFAYYPGAPATLDGTVYV